MNTTFIAALATACTLVAAPMLRAAEPKSTPKEDKTEATKPVVKPYPLDTCLVSGKKLTEMSGKPYVFVYQGQEFKMCCKACRKEFDKNPDEFLKKLEEK